MTFIEGWNEWRDDLQKIKTAELHGIERPVGIGLFVLNTVTPTRIIQLLCYGRRDKAPRSLPDWYVCLATLLLVILFLLPPSGSVVIAAYLLFSITVYLLNVVLLDHKVFGGVRSPERSLILFMLNVAQVVLIFAIFYRWLEVDDPFVQALLVFGTISFPPKRESMAAFQIATDFMLLAVFLAHFVGRVGIPTASQKLIIELIAQLKSRRGKQNHVTLTRAGNTLSKLMRQLGLDTRRAKPKPSHPPLSTLMKSKTPG